MVYMFNCYIAVSLPNGLRSAQENQYDTTLCARHSEKPEAVGTHRN